MILAVYTLVLPVFQAEDLAIGVLEEAIVAGLIVGGLSSAVWH